MTILALSDLMSALSAELSRLSQATERMHDLVCFSPEGRRRNDPRFLADAQSIDHTVQVLDDLARFLTELSGDATTQGDLNAEQALASLRLAELRHRLAPASEPVARPTVASGVCELF